MRFVVFLLLSGKSFIACAQGSPTDSLPGDPGTVAVYNVQNLSFGAFSHGVSGGSISIAPNGTRSVTGSVNAFSLGVAFFQAIYELEAPSGSIVTIVNGPNATLTGSNGGTMSLKIDGSLPLSPFNTILSPPQRTPINIGATLTVGSTAANPPGSYAGNFYVTFNYQ